MTEITIGIVDDDTLIVELLSDYFNSQADVSVVIKADSGEACVEALKTIDKKPDVLLVDLRMKEMTGIELLGLVGASDPDIKCIVLSSYYKRSFMGFILKTGATAFLPKGIPPKELILIIKDVHSKGYYFMPDQMEIVREQLSSKTPKPELVEDELLSEREKEIIQLICQQKTADEIGEILFITRRTVEGHKNNMYAKTGAKNLVGLVIYAIQNKIVDSDHVVII